jgi:hypothetical protein
VNETLNGPTLATSETIQSEVVYNKANTTLTVMYLIDERNDNDIGE